MIKDLNPSTSNPQSESLLQSNVAPHSIVGISILQMIVTFGQNLHYVTFVWV